MWNPTKYNLHITPPPPPSLLIFYGLYIGVYIRFILAMCCSSILLSFNLPTVTNLAGIPIVWGFMSLPYFFEVKSSEEKGGTLCMSK